MRTIEPTAKKKMILQTHCLSLASTNGTMPAVTLVLVDDELVAVPFCEV